ncbi:unnamed protein product [Pleuronectes platessa]|uniref:Uncharacterized protein n=1 Tax=Pleuronectes platessa TaxID=8262 RepID=A0A9N7YKI0_PLEPL|nr:unnamed protein product [Pleuronectes platessa]
MALQEPGSSRRNPLIFPTSEPPPPAPSNPAYRLDKTPLIKECFPHLTLLFLPVARPASAFQLPTYYRIRRLMLRCLLSAAVIQSAAAAGLLHSWIVSPGSGTIHLLCYTGSESLHNHQPKRLASGPISKPTRRGSGTAKYPVYTRQSIPKEQTRSHKSSLPVSCTLVCSQANRAYELVNQLDSGG